MGTYVQSAADRWLQRAIIVAAAVLALAVLGLAGLYVRERVTQPTTSLADRRVEQAKAAVRSDPNNADARVTLGSALLTKRMYREALEQFQEILRANEWHQAALIGAGVASARLRQDDQAVQYFQKVVEINQDKDFVDVDRRLNAVYYELGRIYLAKGQMDEAVDSLQKALRIDRTDADVLMLLGQALTGQGNLDEAMYAYRSAAAFVPDFVDAYQGLITAAEKKGDADWAAYGKAMIAFSTGKYDEAIRGLEAIVSNMDQPDAATGLGLTYEAKGDKAKALEAYQKAVSIDPDARFAKNKVTQLSVAQ